MTNPPKTITPLKNKNVPVPASHSVWRWLWRNGRLAILLVSFFISQAGVERTTTGIVKTVLLLGLVFIEFGFIAYWEVYSVR